MLVAIVILCAYGAAMSTVAVYLQVRKPKEIATVASTGTAQQSVVYMDARHEDDIRSKLELDE